MGETIDEQITEGIKVLELQIKAIKNLMKEIKNPNQCLHCGETFKRGPKDHNKKFCNTKCRGRYYYHQRRDHFVKLQRDDAYKKNIEKYGKKSMVRCLICGKFYRQLGSHVFMTHKITAKEYREQFGFDIHETRHTLASDLRELYGKQALENGTYKNLEKGKKTRFKKGDKKVGRYKRSFETMQRLRTKNKSNMNLKLDGGCKT